MLPRSDDRLRRAASSVSSAIASRLPNGARRRRMDVVRHRGSVVLIPQPSPATVILIRQYPLRDRPLDLGTAGRLARAGRGAARARRGGSAKRRSASAAAHAAARRVLSHARVLRRADDLLPLRAIWSTPPGPSRGDEDEQIEPRTFSLTEAWRLVAPRSSRRHENVRRVTTWSAAYPDRRARPVSSRAPVSLLRVRASRIESTAGAASAAGQSLHWLLHRRCSLLTSCSRTRRPPCDAMRRRLPRPRAAAGGGGGGRRPGAGHDRHGRRRRPMPVNVRAVGNVEAVVDGRHPRAGHRRAAERRIRGRPGRHGRPAALHARLRGRSMSRVKQAEAALARDTAQSQERCRRSCARQTNLLKRGLVATVRLRRARRAGRVARRHGRRRRRRRREREAAAAVHEDRGAGRRAAPARCSCTRARSSARTTRRRSS